MLKPVLFASMLLLFCGCGEAKPGPDGTEQDAIEAYIEANPNVDDGLDVIDENDTGE